MAELFFISNDKYFPAGTPVIGPGNRSFRYGDGIFETMKMVEGNIINKDFHFDRLFKGLSTLEFDIPKHLTPAILEKKIKDLANKNRHATLARVRLVLFRSNGGVFDAQTMQPDFIIESWPLTGQQQLNTNGLIIDVFPAARKSCDAFANLKSNNYLPYIMAGLYAKKNKLNDAILLNSFDRICDSVIANVFIIKGERIETPPLSEGCVAGVMRRWMVEKFNLKPYVILEKKLSINDLLDADEIFLTNAIYHIKWVKSFKEKSYTNLHTTEIYNYISNHLV